MGHWNTPLLPFLRMGLCSLVMIGALVAAEEQGKDDKKWDVDNPPDPSFEAQIETTEGTWMSLDVSPDGKTLIFDMLGDLYSMPIGGGTAKALTSGVAWDMQPRFSPDGKWIAFTSDRAGGDNLWIMKADGSDAKAVTAEDFRLLNSPVWHPNGEYLAGRKHFTKTRSLGSGEIWLYHRSGGSGVQLVAKPNDQKDLGEPAFSPDGRYLYYSQDTTPGAFFEYSKDPNPGIYSIKRVDLEKGETTTLISGTGGAIRPTPSPDGKTIAYIGRHDYKTALFLLDNESWKITQLTDTLDRDLQETWAIHGVYPTMAWLPDGSSIVYWANGTFHKINVATKAITDIPFTVKTSRKMVKPLRFTTEVAPDAFDVRTLRWVEVSPKGDSVVYSAMGYLYTKKLPNGEPTRLTSQNDHLEYYPSFSRDGQWILYASWDDDELGAIRMIPAKGGASKVVTKAKGHYTWSAMSPDGKQIAYIRTEGGYLRSPLWSKDSGLYVVNTNGGEATRIGDGGDQLHFGADSNRLFYVTRGAEGKSILNSMKLDGSEPREHAEVAMGLDFRVSPDGKWLAFTEHYNAHITPMIQAGKALGVAAGDRSLPTRQVSKDAGLFLHWSGDSSTLHWSMGPTLFKRDLKEAFSFIPGAPESLPDPQDKGINIGLKVPHDQPKGSVAYVGGRIITMNGSQVIENGAVVVEGNRIIAVGPTDQISIPADAHRVDTSGKTLMPGIIDVHAHGAQATEGMIPEQNWHNLAGLAFGVTTIHDPSNNTYDIYTASEMARAGTIVAPRIFSTGTILYGAQGPGYTAKINSLEDAKSHLRRLQAVGAISVKSYNQPRRDQRQQVITGARELEMMVVPEGGSLYQHNMTQVVDGHTGIEHAIPLARMYSDVAQFWSSTPVFYTPTIIVGYGGIWGENYWYDTTDVFRNERLTSFLPPDMLDGTARRRTKAPLEEYNHFRIAEMCKMLTDAGVKVTLGAHGQREGLGAHWELWMFGQGGMTPLEALRSATLNGAEYLGMDKDLGSLEKGKLADILILDANPLDDLFNSTSISQVVLNGRIYDAATMNELGKNPRERAPLFWEQGGAGASNAHSHSAQQHRCGCNL